MTAGPEDLEPMLVQQDLFAGEQFWTTLNRLADRRGHQDHQRVLVGSAEQTSRYELRCLSCARPVATIDVLRETPAT